MKEYVNYVRLLVFPPLAGDYNAAFAKRLREMHLDYVHVYSAEEFAAYMNRFATEPVFDIDTGKRIIGLSVFDSFEVDAASVGEAQRVVQHQFDECWQLLGNSEWQLFANTPIENFKTFEDYYEFMDIVSVAVKSLDMGNSSNPLIISTNSPIEFA